MRLVRMGPVDCSSNLEKRIPKSACCLQSLIISTIIINISAPFLWRCASLSLGPQALPTPMFPTAGVFGRN